MVPSHAKYNHFIMFFMLRSIILRSHHVTIINLGLIHECLMVCSELLIVDCVLCPILTDVSWLWFVYCHQLQSWFIPSQPYNIVGCLLTWIDILNAIVGSGRNNVLSQTGPIYHTLTIFV
mgnify:CR=1 FL=1